MSVIDKLKLVGERRADLDKSLDAGAQELLDLYDEVAKRAENSFGKHRARLAEEKSAADELADAVDRLSNDLGNSQS